MATQREQAGLPFYPELRCKTLAVLRSMAMPVSNDEVDLAVAQMLQLSNAQRQVMSTNGRQTELAYRVAWARSGLRAIGALDRVGKGTWRLTEKGEALACDELERQHRQYLANKRLERGKEFPATTADISLQQPDAESIEQDWKDVLLERLFEVSPGGFEHLSAALLRVAGFDDVDVTGRSGDGGIDGIGVYRPSGLISFHTAFQCKRYQGSVGASTVRDFRGSFVGRADRGIIITTGYFTRDARDEAARPGANPVDLIDGEALCELLREHSLGVRTTTRVVEDIIIDDAYFNQFDAAEESS